MSRPEHAYPVGGANPETATTFSMTAKFALQEMMSGLGVPLTFGVRVGSPLCAFAPLRLRVNSRAGPNAETQRRGGVEMGLRDHSDACCHDPFVGDLARGWRSDDDGVAEHNGRIEPSPGASIDMTPHED
jgi:hypothetical protein